MGKKRPLNLRQRGIGLEKFPKPSEVEKWFKLPVVGLSREQLAAIEARSGLMEEKKKIIIPTAKEYREILEEDAHRINSRINVLDKRLKRLMNQILIRLLEKKFTNIIPKHWN